MFDWILLLVQILVINIVLSGDNAVVIALASKNLPLAQRKQAIWWGAFGAIALRMLLTLAAVYLLYIPFIQGLGSLLLFWIAVKLLIEDDSSSGVKEASTLAKAVRTIIAADFVMSLDNVLAIAAKAHHNLSVIIIGVGLSIPIIIWGSNMVMRLLHRFPVLIYIGAGILGYTAGEMFLSDTKMKELLMIDLPHWSIKSGAALLVVAVGVLYRLTFQPKQAK